MAYNFKSIADVEVVEAPAETANVLIEENGVVKKAPKTAVGGAGGGVIVYDCVDNSLYLNGNPVSLAEAKAEYDAGSNLRIKFTDLGFTCSVVGFQAQHTDDGDGIFCYFITNEGVSNIQVWI